MNVVPDYARSVMQTVPAIQKGKKHLASMERSEVQKLYQRIANLHVDGHSVYFISQELEVRESVVKELMRSDIMQKKIKYLREKKNAAVGNAKNRIESLLPKCTAVIEDALDNVFEDSTSIQRAQLATKVLSSAGLGPTNNVNMTVEQRVSPELLDHVRESLRKKKEQSAITVQATVVDGGNDNV